MTTVTTAARTRGVGPDRRPASRTAWPRRLRPFVGGDLPVRLRAWDGSEAGPADAPLVELRSPDAVRRLLWHPGELGAAQAYVTGELEVHERTAGTSTAPSPTRSRSPRERGLGGRAALARGRRPGACARPPASASLGPPAGRPGVAGADPRPAAQRAARPARDQPPLRPLQRVLLADPRASRWPTPAATTTDDPTYSLEEAQRDKLDLVCRKLGLEPGHARCSTSAAAGARCPCTPPSTSARRSPASRSRPSRRRSSTPGSPSAAWRTGSRSGCRTTARCPERGHVRRRRLDRDGRARRRAATTRRTPRCCTASVQPGRPGAGPADVAHRRGWHPGGGPFIESFIAPDMHMRPVGETVAHLERGGLEVRDVHAPARALRAAPSRAGWRASRPTSTGSPRWSARRSCGSGGSTSSAARWPSATGGWASTRSSLVRPGAAHTLPAGALVVSDVLAGAARRARRRGGRR